MVKNQYIIKQFENSHQLLKPISVHHSMQVTFSHFLLYEYNMTFWGEIITNLKVDFLKIFFSRFLDFNGKFRAKLCLNNVFMLWWRSFEEFCLFLAVYVTTNSQI